jgi:hypothetical protein
MIPLGMDDLPENPSEQDFRDALVRRGLPPELVEGLDLAQVHAALGLPGPEDVDEIKSAK